MIMDFRTGIGWDVLDYWDRFLAFGRHSFPVFQILLAALCFFSVGFVSGQKAFAQSILQPAYSFEHLSQEQGLSYNTVTSFAQDKQGFLWIATFNGLNRYDGVQFKTFPQNNRNNTSSDSAMPREIRLVYADQRGNVWIVGFDNSIGRFNPRTEEFMNFSLPIKDIQRDFVNAILEDGAGALWLTTVKGLFYLNRQQQRFLPYTTSDGKPLLQNSLGGIAEFPVYAGQKAYTTERHFWIRKHGGLIEFDPIRNNVTHYNFVDSAYDKQFFYGSVVRDSSGYLWCSDIEGLYCFDIRTKSIILHIARKTFARASLIKNPLQNDFMIRSTLCAPDGTLWFAASGGIVVVRYQGSPQHHSLELLQNDETNPLSLSGNTVRTLFADRTGVIWAGGEPFGINKFTPYRYKFLLFRHLPFNQNSLSNNYVRGLCLTRNNILWAGTQFGGISRYEPQKRLWTRFRKIIGQNLPDAQRTINEAWSVFEDRFGTVWAGTRGNGLLRFDEALGGFVQSPLVPKTALIQIIREDGSGNLLLGTRGNTLFVGVFVIPPDRKKEHVVFIPTKQAESKHMLSGDVQTIHEDRQGILWIGGASEIMCLNRQTGVIEDKTPKFIKDVGGLSSNVGSVVVSIIEDRNGMLWLSSKGLGLVMYDRANDTFTAINEQHGLPSNSVYATLEDSSGNFWISSDAGLTRWNRAENTFRTFTTSDGLQGREYNRLSYCKGADGMMFFGGINGFNAFHPDKLLVNPNPPPVVLTSVKIFAEEKAPGSIITTSSEGHQTLKLRYDQNFITFQFAALDFHVPENNQYRYRLEGVDQNWIANGTRREAVYTNLEHGEYVFRVRGANNDGVWNIEGLTLHVVILPPWWATWWFRLILIFAGLGAVTTTLQTYRRRIQRLQQHREELLLHIEERRRAEDELQNSEEKFRALFETSPLGMVLWEEDGRILEVNAAFSHLSGYTIREAVTTSFWNLLSDVQSASIRYSLQQRRSFGPIEQVLTQATGTKLSVVLYGIAITDNGNSVQKNGRIWTVIEDITERKRALDAMLRYQLNPHFMFNVLNSVNALMGENQRNAKRMIIQFSSLLRHTLVASGKQTAPLGDEMEAVEHYLAIEKLRFEERLEARVDADRRTLGLNIPVFLVQPLVENAIKYGMQTTQGTLHLTIVSRLEKENLVIEVSNTGVWVESINTATSSSTATNDTAITKQRSTGIGLENLRKRLAQLYSDDYTMSISQEQGMVMVRITLSVRELVDATTPSPTKSL
jgi:PAS domain S-box-containing protein